jgi:tetraacyldisaccharide 4'-kinase
VATWVARRLAARGIVPGILTGRRGADEAQVHREQVRQAIVLQGSDRLRAARQAQQLGAQAIVMDDGFQRLGLLPDVKLLLLSADSAGAARWLLPAGPWREPARALRRADMVIVTRKRTSARLAAAYAERLRSAGVEAGRLGLLHLRIGTLSALTSGEPVALDTLRGVRVMAVCGVAQPESFAWQLGALGAEVEILAFPDHHVYTRGDLRRLLSKRGHFGYVVVTHKDAVKLRALWPSDGVPALVAHLAVEWERGEERAEALITHLTTIT